MKSQIHISIADPCSQEWEGMEPGGNGRFCAHCQKSVTDFTTMTDAQVLDFLKHNSLGCGRFTNTQLNRPFIAPKRYYWPKAWMQHLMLGAGLAFGVTQTATAQTKPGQQIQRRVGDINAQEPYTPTVIIIQVVDDQSNPCINARVEANSVNKYSQSAITDSMGSFMLTIPYESSLKHLVLDIYHNDKKQTFTHNPRGILSIGDFKLANNRTIIRLMPNFINLSETATFITGYYTPDDKALTIGGGQTVNKIYYIDGKRMDENGKPVRKSFWRKLMFWR